MKVIKISSNGLRLLTISLLVAVISGCASQACILNKDQLPAFPTYEVNPIESPWNVGIENKGQRKCVLVLYEDQAYLVNYTKRLCYTLTEDKAYCGLE